MLRSNINQSDSNNEAYKRNIQSRVISIINSYYERDIQEENETINFEME